jgi:hypothetical protein
MAKLIVNPRVLAKQVTTTKTTELLICSIAVTGIPSPAGMTDNINRTGVRNGGTVHTVTKMSLTGIPLRLERPVTIRRGSRSEIKCPISR